MRFGTLMTAAAASLLLAGAAYAASVDQPGHQSPAPGSNNEAASAIKDTTAGLVGRVDAAMTHTTKGFVDAAAVSDMYEVEAGKIAAERATKPGIKQFAQEMVRAHTDTTNKLKSIIASNKINVAPPPAVDNRRQGMLDDLRGAKGEDFDHRYLAQQVAAHKEADTLFSGYAKDGDNAAIKSFARETDPVIKQHLAMAQNLSEGKDAMDNMARK
ncbi:MAG TPA: DUF4142 domain-containing protein [Rhizomicrobium sp.]|nr:DUF4142 domain-containing protein [Rhizomicrobium sp.]